MTEENYPPPPPTPEPPLETPPPAKGFHGPGTNIFRGIRIHITQIENEHHTPMQRSLKLGLVITLILGASMSVALSMLTQLATGMAPTDPVLLVIIAPITEEPFKALSMLIVALFVWKTIPSRRHAAVLGAATGLGFAITESILYTAQLASLSGQVINGQLVPSGLVAEAIIARWMGLPFMHVVWSAIVGVGMFVLLAKMKEKTTSPSWLILPFLLIGLFNHICWNGLAVALTGQDPVLSVIINVLVVFTPFAFIFRDFLGGHFNFWSFLTPVSEPLPTSSETRGPVPGVPPSEFPPPPP
jgi:RsiW-degrading membrane proteinase PrsW (M82 family)